MTTTGSHRIAWQRGNFAVYAGITLSVKSAAGVLPVGSVHGLDTVAEQWRIGVMFGLSLLRESSPRKLNFQNVPVTITSFLGQPCDTTLMAVAFVTFHAAAKALSVDVSEVFTFDDSIGAFQISYHDVRSLGEQR